MNNIKTERKILSIAPSTNGFGFAFTSESGTLIECGTKWIQAGNKNKKSLATVMKMIGRSGADVIVLPDASEKDSKRDKRIRKLVRQIASVGKKHGIAVRLISQKELQDHFFVNDTGTKYARATILAQRFPQELAHRLPPKREAWMSENAKLYMFDAVAFGLAYKTSEVSRIGNPKSLKLLQKSRLLQIG